MGWPTTKPFLCLGRRLLVLVLLQLGWQTSFARTYKALTLTQHHWGKEGCVLVKSAYTPSRLETDWLATMHSQGDDDYCKSINSLAGGIDTWLSGIKQDSLRGTEGHDIFSRFTHHFQCGNRVRHTHSWIEPLFGAMRHPRWLCLNGNNDLLSRSYLLLETSDILAVPSYIPRRTFYFDLGASLYSSGPGGASQQWLLETYKARGITFDRMLLWEAKPYDTSLIMRDVPKDMLHAYQYINLPATADINDPANPFNQLKQITLPSDFVVVKLDIDHPQTEAAFITQMLHDQDILIRIDEMFYEHHIRFKPLMDCCWHEKVDNMTLSESLHLFQRLRYHGVRMHGWP